MAALDVLHVSLAQAELLFFVWEIKFLVGKVSGLLPATGSVMNRAASGSFWAFITKSQELGRSQMPLPSLVG